MGGAWEGWEGGRIGEVRGVVWGQKGCQSDAMCERVISISADCAVIGIVIRLHLFRYTQCFVDGERKDALVKPVQ